MENVFILWKIYVLITWFTNKKNNPNFLKSDTLCIVYPITKFYYFSM